MSEFIIRVLSFAFTAAIMASLVSLCLRFTPGIPPKNRAFIWLVMSFGPLLVLIASLAGLVTGAFNLVPIFESFVMRTLHVGRFGEAIFQLRDGYWQPITAAANILQALFIVWAVGAGLLLIVRGYQLFLAQQFSIWAEDTQDERMVHEAQLLGESFGVASKPKIRESHLVRSPLVVGILRFTLLMPNGMSRTLTDEELRAILAHEFSHIAKHDTRMLAFLILNECVFWFNPATWLVHREWATCRELDADQEAIVRSKIEPKRFASLLLSIVTSSRQPWLQTAIGATRDFKALKTRLLNMKISSQQSNRFTFRTATTMTVVGALLLLPWQISKAAPTSDETNLVVNGGFESGLDSWTVGSMPDGATTRVNYGVDTNEKHSGKASFKFEKKNLSYFPIQHIVAKLTPHKPTRRLETICWIKANNAGKATISIAFNDSTGQTSDMTWGAYASGPSAGQGITHEWKKYRSVIEVPSGTKSIGVYVQMYGPGQAWFDDVSVRFVDDATPLVNPVDDSGKGEEVDPIADVKDVPNIEFQAKKDPNKDYFLIGSKGKGPETGYKLLLVLPGGPGSKDANPFVRRIWKFAELEKMGFVIAELIAPVWENSEDRIVWPIRSFSIPAAKFKTEEFVNDVITDVKSKIKIDPEHIYALGWSSGGPATYAALLDAPALKGAFVAMSVFNENQYPTLKLAKGRSLYIYQSPDDKVTKFFFAEKARDAFKAAGVRVEMVSYPGGHGFNSGQPYEDIRAGLEWLTKR